MFENFRFMKTLMCQVFFKNRLISSNDLNEDVKKLFLYSDKVSYIITFFTYLLLEYITEDKTI